MTTAVHLPPIVSSDCGPTKCQKSSSCSREEADKSRICSLAGLSECFDTNKMISKERIRLALTNPRVIERRPCHGKKVHITAMSSHPYFIREPPATERSYAGKSPYDLPKNDLDRFFMSGYQGFIPKSQYLYGRSFPHTSYEALGQFQDQERYLTHMKTQPVAAMEPRGGGRQKGYIVYRDDSGIIPHYSGHIPGNLVDYE